ncbi:metal-dependent hydrolase [Bacillus sp. FJAT-45350]|uniref:metal-dependent hydrolase n=1 Tax=Bacillus sp. FJAT-45350 TaxID=2011014 RepID=UPI000BB6C269|nr:metal-dependent hydrolase [Bacillus sp. FJAT-45350]
MKITRLGHAMFTLETKKGFTMLFDPFIGMNSVYKELDFSTINAVVLTHGHFDHTEGMGKVKEANASIPVIAQYELALQFMGEGFGQVIPMNFGGTVALGDVSITMVYAQHTSSYKETQGVPVYAGVACGYIIECADEPTIYVSGDTGLTKEMEVIQDCYKPEIALLSVGDFLTMGVRESDYAVRNLLNVKKVVPLHTFPTRENSESKEVYDALKQNFPIIDAMTSQGVELKERLSDHSTEVVLVDFNETVDLG